jgi:hypothetical protein
LTYTASTRTISGITLNEITSEYVGSPLLFIIGAVTYFGFISSVTSDLSSTTVVLAVSASLPSSSGTVTSITVIAYNDASDIITLTDLKQYLGVTVTGTDAMFASWITEISSILESRLGYPVMPRDVEELANGAGGSKIYLRGRILSIYGDTENDRLANLQYRNSVSSDWINLLTDENSFWLNPDDAFAVYLLDSNYFPSGIKNIRIKYNSGMSDVQIAEFSKIAKEMIQIMWDESKSGMQPRLGMSSKNRGGAGSNLGDSFLDMNPRWQKTIDRYRKML